MIRNTARVSSLVMATALVVIACGPTPPPTTSPTPPPTPAASTPTPSPSAALQDRLEIVDAGYLAGTPFMVSVGEAGIDWAVPSGLPMMPNGQQAARVAFLPATCATGDLTITVEDAPRDKWETNLETDGTAQGNTLMSWPAAQVPECAGGLGRTYLQVAYHPLPPLRTIHLAATVSNSSDAAKVVDVVPVFTSADATQPAFAPMTTIGFEPLSGKELPRSAKAQLLGGYDFNLATLPDGSAPTHWGFLITGCGPMSGRSITISVRVGDAAPVEVGRCSEGSLQSDQISLPVPANGTRIVVLMAGGTTKSQLRVSEFQWRGDRP